MPKPRTIVRISPTRATIPARLPSSTASRDQNRCIIPGGPSRVDPERECRRARYGRSHADRRLQGGPGEAQLIEVVPVVEHVEDHAVEPEGDEFVDPLGDRLLVAVHDAAEPL